MNWQFCKTSTFFGPLPLLSSQQVFFFINFSYRQWMLESRLLTDASIDIQIHNRGLFESWYNRAIRNWVANILYDAFSTTWRCLSFGSCFCLHAWLNATEWGNDKKIIPLKHYDLFPYASWTSMVFLLIQISPYCCIWGAFWHN